MARWIVALVVFFVVVVSRAGAMDDSWTCPSTIRFDDLRREIQTFVPTDDARTWAAIEAAYVAYLDAHEQMRLVDAKRWGERLDQAQNLMPSAEDAARAYLDHRRFLRRAAAPLATLFDVIQAALPEERRDAFVPIRQWGEMQIDLRLTGQSRALSDLQIEEALLIGADEENRAALRDGTRDLRAMLAPFLKRWVSAMDDESRDMLKPENWRLPGWVPGTPIDPEAQRAWLAHRWQGIRDSVIREARIRVDVDRRICDFAVKLSEKLTGEARRAFLLVATRCEWSNRRLLWRLDQRLSALDVDDAARAKAKSILEEWHRSEEKWLQDRIRAAARRSAAHLEHLPTMMQGLPDTWLDDWNNESQSIGDERNAAVKAVVDRIAAALAPSITLNLDAIEWKFDPNDQSGAIVNDLRIGPSARDPDEDWDPNRWWTNNDADWWYPPIGRADFDGLAKRLGLEGAARATVDQLEASQRAAFDGAITAKFRESRGHDMRSDEHAALIRESDAMAIAERARLFADIDAAIGSDDQRAAIEFWRCGASLPSIFNVMARHTSDMASGAEWLWRAGNAIAALQAIELTDDARGALESALLPAARRLRDAQRDVDVEERDADLERTKSRDYWDERATAEVREEKRKRYMDCVARCAERLAPVIAARGAASQAFVKEVEGRLDAESLKQFSRAHRRTAFPRIDAERERFEPLARAAIALAALDESRRKAIESLVANWSEGFEKRTEQLANAGIEGRINQDPKASLASRHAGGESVWFEFRRRQEGQMMLMRVATTLTKEERAKIPALARLLAER